MDIFLICLCRKSNTIKRYTAKNVCVNSVNTYNINSFRRPYGEILPDTKNSIARACEGNTVFVEGNISQYGPKKELILYTH